VPQFARLARVLDPALISAPDLKAAEQCGPLTEAFLRRIGLQMGLADVQVPESELTRLASQCMVLPDYKGNPRVATLAEMELLVREAYRIQSSL
jgi:alcohol dehydrogenase class IV